MKVAICFGLLCILALVTVVPGMESSVHVTVQENQHQPYVPVAYAESDTMEPAQYPSPLQQHNDGIPLHDIQCNTPRELYVTASQMPVCLYPDTYQTLLDRGVSLSQPPTPESAVRGVVDEAIALYDSDPDGAFATITAMMSTDSLYPFVLDSTCHLVAHGANPDLLGGDFIVITQSDKPCDMILSELQEGEVWLEYMFQNPATGAEQHKRSLIVLHDGYIFGSGYYAASDDKMADESMSDAMSSLGLTAEEAAWLEENGTIRVTYNSGWSPLEYADESGNLAGVMLEYAKEFSRQTGAEFVGSQSASIWSDVAEMVRDGKADVMFSVIHIPERLEYMDFTSTHHSIEARMVTVDDRQISMDEAGLKLLTIEGYDIASWLDENHPDLEYVLVGSFGEAFEMLGAGDGDALVATWPVASYHAAQAGIDNIHDAGPTGYQYDLKVGYSNQNPILGSILQKVVDNIPASQIEQWYADAAP